MCTCTGPYQPFPEAHLVQRMLQPDPALRPSAAEIVQASSIAPSSIADPSRVKDGLEEAELVVKGG